MKALILAALAATAFTFGNPDRHRDIEEHFTTQPSQRIEMRGFNGTDIRVQSWDKNEVYVKLSISFSSSNSRDEQRFLDAITLKGDQSADGMTITYREPDISDRNHDSFWSWVSSFFSGRYTKREVDGEIYVPLSNPLTADVKYGSISLDGMKGPLKLRGTGNTVVLKNCSAIQEVTNDYGKTTVQHSGGSLDLESKSGTITVDQFTGKAMIDADYSNITVRDVSQTLSIHSTSGTVKVERIGGNTTIRSDYSNITASNISGVLEIEGKSGRVTAKTVDGIKVTSSYSPIDVSDVSGKASKEITLLGQSGNISLTDAVGNVKIENPYGKIDLQNVRGNIGLRGTHVEAENITGDWESETQYGTVTARNLTSTKILMTSKSGKIDLKLKTPPSIVDIKNEYADVNVDMPAGFSGDVDLNVSYGNIHTNLQLDKEKSFDGGGGYAMGKIGKGNGKISVETKSANINVTQR